VGGAGARARDRARMASPGDAREARRRARGATRRGFECRVFPRGTRDTRACDARAVDRPRRREARRRAERVRGASGTRASPRARDAPARVRVSRATRARLSRSRRATRNGERLEAIGEAEAVVSNGNERKEGPSIERSDRASVDRKTKRVIALREIRAGETSVRSEKTTSRESTRRA